MRFTSFKQLIFGIFFFFLCFSLSPLSAVGTTPVKHHSAHHTAKKTPHHKSDKHRIKEKKAQKKNHFHKDKKHSIQKSISLNHASSLNLGQVGVCTTAKSQLGKPYEWGGDTPSDGFDCSGFSQYVYGKEGVKIPRTALAQYASLTPVRHLENGDLVFFRTFGRHVSHVGIYLGNGYFIHSPKTGERIRIDNIDEPYWHEHYAGARRVLTNQA
ncbi:MAG: C40 family peptidase [Gammaproteobacteria bacterium]|nr:C40 family peptidase [Gammaproteobacteria bacterium]